jgi:hypothetical protein
MRVFPADCSCRLCLVRDLPDAIVGITPIAGESRHPQDVRCEFLAVVCGAVASLSDNRARALIWPSRRTAAYAFTDPHLVPKIKEV